MRETYTDAFKRLGYRLVIPEWPLARGAALAGQGSIDGLLQRAAFYQGIDPQLLRVPEHHFRGAGVRALGVMDEQTMHVYLNRKHAELVPRLSIVLHHMKEEGLIEKYRIQAGRPPL